MAITIAIPGGEALAPEDPQPAPGHRRRALDPGHHRRRRALQLRRLDPLDPSRHRRGARGRPRPRRRRHRLDLRAGGPGALRPARDGAARHGRLRRRDAEVSAPAPGPAPVTLAGGFAKLAKLAQGHLDLHSVALRARPGGAGRAGRRSTARRRRWPRRSPAPTRPTRCWRWPTAPGFPLADLVAARARAVGREVAGPDDRARGDRGRPAGQGGRPGAGMVSRVLILGGTAEAGALARALAAERLGRADPVAGRAHRGGAGRGRGHAQRRVRRAGRACRLSARHRRRRRVRRDPPLRRADHRARRARLRGRRRAALPPAAGRAGSSSRATAGMRWRACRQGLDWLLPRARRVFVTLGRTSLAELGAAQAFTFVMRGITRPPDLPGNVVWVTGPAAVPGRGRGRAAAPARGPGPVHPGQRRRAHLRQARGGARAAACRW